MRRALPIVFIFITAFANAQKVGLVLSGGAAKGLAHVGVLKALEENEIPIDYVVGTSMGGIIGGCYVAGMSPGQIEDMVLSEHFLRWINGLPETGYNYYYHRPDETPQFLKVNLALDSTFNFQLNSSIANDVSLNFVLAEKMAQASAISNSNFDSLFVPFRVVAADIFTQNEVVLSKGSLSDALRATQTVPFFYNPIRVDGKYLFDGGVYNNFPVDVAQRDFNPDVILGVNVSGKIFDEYPYDQDEKLISHSLLYLLLDKSDPARIPSSGVYIQPNLKGFTSFDFARVKSLIDSGYVQTMRQMDEIKQKVAARVACDDVMTRRNRFNDQNVPMAFDAILFKGYSSNQRGYIRTIFRNRKNQGKFQFSQIKSGYFKLVSEDYFTNTYPSILYNHEQRNFNLQLTRRPQQNFQVGFGGVIATRDISNVFLGLNYYYFNKILTHYSADFQTGNYYKSAILKLRMDFPYQFYLEPMVSFDSWDYLNNDDLLRSVSLPTILRRINRKYGVRVGVPVKNSFKGIFSIEGISNIDRYINGDVFISTDQLDELRLRGYKAGLSLSTNTLNRRQYASAGRSFAFSGEYFSVREKFAPGNTSVRTSPASVHHSWFRARATAEQYFNLGWYKLGYLTEVVFSNQPPFQNYTGTIINAPAFMPMQDSRTLLLQNFRSFNYLAGGIRNVFTLRNKLDFRVEGYLFKPLDYLQENANQEAVNSEDLNTFFFAGTAGLVFHSPIGPLSLSVNYYDDRENQLGILLHVGFLLFNKHSLE
ncbi:patatin-like phospholipase family protein [Chryseolinea lacunae]|uniref:Patatin-like phospholipase family protein n=1 Tax=Chryseolinea lacunae TaxID=2801331 RepID=A0ABS1KRQ9_9BACT|nr:patatin-like phospholipase family protein [Chryseolinea lacunae]MBL0741947.1 patatin-like phospholipase family protein [Chryseolinea lacunae]